MSADGNTVSAVESKLEEGEENPASGSITSKVSVQLEAKENVNVKPELHSKQALPSEKTKEMLELKKMGKPRAGLPPINVNELTTILQDPSMPSQDLMKEIAHKIMVRSEENESKAATIDKINPLGMRSVFDCIMEVTLNHSDNSSDEEEEDVHEPHLLEIPCEHCKKIFGSTMSLKTHILMSHSQDDPSVLNVRLRASIDEERASEQPSKKDEGLMKAGKVELQSEKGTKPKSRSCGGSLGQGAAPIQPVTQVDKKLSKDSISQQDLTPKLSESEKMLVSESTATSDSPAENIQTKTSPSSLRNRKRSMENQATTAKNSSKPDLKESTTTTTTTTTTKSAAKAQLSSTSPTQSSSASGMSGKRKSDNTPPPSPSIKKSRKSHGDKPVGDKESVPLRRSSRRK